MAAMSEPKATPLTNDGRQPAVLPWEEGRRRIAEARYYWLATLHPVGRPHVRPVLAVWTRGALYTTSSPLARKGRNLERNDRCTVAIDAADMHLVIEGRASRVMDQGVLAAVADSYQTKYAWPVTVTGEGFDAPYGAPTAGPPPYQPYEIRPENVLAFVNDAALGASSTRWRFPNMDQLFG